MALVYTGAEQIPSDRENERDRIVRDRIQNRRRWLSLKRRWRYGIYHSRELGNLAPYLRYKGWPSRDGRLAVTRGVRLFNKNAAER